jgi:hypothetical protein
LFDEASLAATTERHHIELAAPRLEVVADASVELSRSTVEGVVFELSSGLPSARHVRLIEQALRADRRAWLFWPAEQAIECVDDERLLSVRRHLVNVKWLKRICQPVDNAVTRCHRVPTALRWIYRGSFPSVAPTLAPGSSGSSPAQPVPLKRPAESSRGWNSGVYVRTDYWKAASADDRMVCMIGQLASMTDRLVCLTTSRDGLLDGASVHHVVMDAPRQTLGQDAIVLAPVHYVPIVKAACQAVAPSLLYDRLSAGQSAGAELSQSLRIPYVVEYLGSDAIIRDALNGATPVYAELYADGARAAAGDRRRRSIA